VCACFFFWGGGTWGPAPFIPNPPLK
jgi:hypothetical protein